MSQTAGSVRWTIQDVEASPGKANEDRDRLAKLKLYSVQGVQEYWIVDRIAQRCK